MIGSIPAASLNAVVLSRFARRGADEVVVAAISGGTIGFLVAIIFVAGLSGGRLDAIFVLWSSATDDGAAALGDRDPAPAALATLLVAR